MNYLDELNERLYWMKLGLCGLISDGVLARWAEERRSDMRTIDVELWVKEKREIEGNLCSNVVRKEERLGGRMEIFSDLEFSSGGVVIGELREEVLQNRLEDFANHKPPLKLTDVEVRARPFP